MAELKYEVPAGDPGTFCKGCGKHIFWVKTKAGKWMPIEWDGSPHWGNCSARDQFKRPRRRMDEED